jgi:hypothetical protein
MSNVFIDQIKPSDMVFETQLGYESGLASVLPEQYSTAGVNTSNRIIGGLRGVAFRKITAGPTGTNGAAANVQSGQQILGATFLTTIPLGTTITTGLEFIINAMDDGTNAADLGLVAVFGVQTKVIAANATVNFGIPTSSTSTFIAAGSGSSANTVGPESTANLTLSSTAGGMSTCTVQITTANGGGASGYAAGSVVLCRLRRIGSNTSDTLAGRVVVLGVHVTTY